MRSGLILYVAIKRQKYSEEKHQDPSTLLGKYSHLPHFPQDASQQSSDSTFPYSQNLCNFAIVKALDPQLQALFFRLRE